MSLISDIIVYVQMEIKTQPWRHRK